MLAARKLVQQKLHDMEMSLRGMLRGFGLKVGKTTPDALCGADQGAGQRASDLANHRGGVVGGASVLLREFKSFEKRVRIMARDDADARLLMTTTGVGAIMALTYALGDRRSRTVQEVEGGRGVISGWRRRSISPARPTITGRISKTGDDGVRTALYQAAHIILTKPVKSSALKSWAMRLAKRVGMKKAKVALARKLAVIMHRMLVDGKPFNPAAGAAA